MGRSTKQLKALRSSPRNTLEPTPRYSSSKKIGKANIPKPHLRAQIGKKNQKRSVLPGNSTNPTDPTPCSSSSITTGNLNITKPAHKTLNMVLEDSDDYILDDIYPSTSIEQICDELRQSAPILPTVLSKKRKATETLSENSNPQKLINSVSRKIKVPLDSKIAILQFMKERKDILFGQFSSNLENNRKVETWKAVKAKVQSLGACSNDRDWKWVRDSLWAVWRSRSLAKRDNARQTGSRGGRKMLPNQSDDLIYEIIGKESPVIEGLPVLESLERQTSRDLFGDQNEEYQEVNLEELDNAVASKSKKKKRVIPDRFQMKRDLQIELLKLETYKRKLEILKLERELHLPRSVFTLDLVTLDPDNIVYHFEAGDE